ncbi:hypothetical protein SRHO_G00027230 [Serrasalmus rhombeus]
MQKQEGGTNPTCTFTDKGPDTLAGADFGLQFSDGGSESASALALALNHVSGAVTGHSKAASIRPWRLPRKALAYGATSALVHPQVREQPCERSRGTSPSTDN